MSTLENLFAEKLLKVKAIKLQPSNPFTWASGWKSPFYCEIKTDKILIFLSNVPGLLSKRPTKLHLLR